MAVAGGFGKLLLRWQCLQYFMVLQGSGSLPSISMLTDPSLCCTALSSMELFLFRIIIEGSRVTPEAVGVVPLSQPLTAYGIKGHQEANGAMAIFLAGEKLEKTTYSGSPPQTIPIDAWSSPVGREFATEEPLRVGLMCPLPLRMATVKKLTTGAIAGPYFHELTCCGLDMQDGKTMSGDFIGNLNLWSKGDVLKPSRKAFIKGAVRAIAFGKQSGIAYIGDMSGKLWKWYVQIMCLVPRHLLSPCTGMYQSLQEIPILVLFMMNQQKEEVSSVSRYDPQTLQSAISVSGSTGLSYLQLIEGYHRHGMW